MPKISYLALGDSYTIGESVEINQRWPMQLVEQLNASDSLNFEEPLIIARTGWRTDELIAAVEREDLQPPYGLVSLLIGVNNQYQGKDIDIYIAEFTELLKTAITLAGGNPENVLVVSIPDYGFTPFGEKEKDRISEELDVYNGINEEISGLHQVMYVNITDISRNSDPVLVAGDNLHPSGEQYSRWVQRILESSDFQKFLSDQAP